MPAILDESTGNASVTCDECGKPITQMTEDGMFCEDYCMLAESKAARKKLEAMLPGLMKMFE